MVPGDLSDVPTLACLNKPQKRALILRDQLRYLEPAHLNNFLRGLTKDEPPTYKNINGTVYPQLTQVSLKEEATRFDLGNVNFPEEGGATYRAYLTVENDRFEMRTEDALPFNDADLASVGIHRFVAENMFSLFKAKYQAIYTRMEKINEARRVAFNMMDHPPARFEEGETLTRLTLKPPAPHEISSRRHSTSPVPSSPHSPSTAPAPKRKTLDPHTTNKRPRTTLSTIPDAVKTTTINTLIPEQVKIDLFNSIASSAFPGFDNVLIAAWNVVTVYANVGSDFPEFHKVVLELKGVLEEFDGARGAVSDGKGEGRKDREDREQAEGQGGENGAQLTRMGAPDGEVQTTPTQTTPREDHAGPSKPIATHQAHSTEDAEKGVTDHRNTTVNTLSQMPPPPRSLQPAQKRQPEAQLARHPADRPLSSLSHSHSLRASPAARPTTSRLTPHPSLSSPSPFQDRTSYKSTPRAPSVHSTLLSHRHLSPQAPGADLMRARQVYAASLSKMARAGGDVKKEGDGDDQKAGVEEAESEGNGKGKGKGKEEMRSAPVARMVAPDMRRGR